MTEMLLESQEILRETEKKNTYALFRGKPISSRVSISDDIMLYLFVIPCVNGRKSSRMAVLNARSTRRLI